MKHVEGCSFENFLPKNMTKSKNFHKLNVTIETHYAQKLKR